MNKSYLDIITWFILVIIKYFREAFGVVCQQR